jgi:SAM-dependent methyltransferase
MIKLNLGHGASWMEAGWQNLDITTGYDLTDRNLQGFADNSVDTVYTSHCLEHIRYEQVVRLIKDIHRALKPNGLLRVIVPDIDIMNDILMHEDSTYLEQHNPHYYTRHQHIPFEKHMEALIGWDYFANPTGNEHMHSCFFSKAILMSLLKITGFGKIEVKDFCYSSDVELCQAASLDEGGMPLSGFDNPNTRFISLYIEAQK